MPLCRHNPAWFPAARRAGKDAQRGGAINWAGVARHFGYSNGAGVKNKYNELKGVPREAGTAKKKRAEGEGEGEQAAASEQPGPPLRRCPCRRRRAARLGPPEVLLLPRSRLVPFAAAPLGLRRREARGEEGEEGGGRGGACGSTHACHRRHRGCVEQEAGTGPGQTGGERGGAEEGGLLGSVWFRCRFEGAGWGGGGRCCAGPEVSGCPDRMPAESLL